MLRLQQVAIRDRGTIYYTRMVIRGTVMVFLSACAMLLGMIGFACCIAAVAGMFGLLNFVPGAGPFQPFITGTIAIAGSLLCFILSGRCLREMSE